MASARLLALLLLIPVPGSPVSAQPEAVRPGIPGERPFWNAHTRRFIAPPAFDVAEIPGADRYRFILVSSADSIEREFGASSPWAPLTPVWAETPPGVIRLEIRAGDSLLFARTFIKSPAFDGTVPEPAYGWVESARRCLGDLLRQEKVQSWLLAARPFPHYPKYAYPAKMVGALIDGMAVYAGIAPDPYARAEALAVAESAATFLRSVTFGPGHPLAGWPPTFWEEIDRDIHPVYPGEVLTTEPARTGLAYLRLYDATGDRRHREAARRIAEGYRRLQLPSGSWHQRVRVEDGGAKAGNVLVPTLIIMFLDRLREGYGIEEFRDVSERAFRWTLEHPMRTYNWEAQFEDTRPRARYRNLSHREPVQFAEILFARGERLDEARELLRFAEDSFVIWTGDDPVLDAELFRPGSRWSGNDPYFGSDWFVPAAVEQYVFFTPIASSSAGFIDAYAAAFRATGERIYLDKALALGATMTRAQRYWGGGEIPTHLRRVMPELNWLNVSVWSARALLDLAPLAAEAGP